MAGQAGDAGWSDIEFDESGPESEPPVACILPAKAAGGASASTRIADTYHGRLERPFFDEIRQRLRGDSDWTIIDPGERTRAASDTLFAMFLKFTASSVHNSSIV